MFRVSVARFIAVSPGDDTVILIKELALFNDGLSSAVHIYTTARSRPARQLLTSCFVSVRPARNGDAGPSGNRMASLCSLLELRPETDATG